jgi:hypothetical protein
VILIRIERVLPLRGPGTGMESCVCFEVGELNCCMSRGRVEAFGGWYIVCVVYG